MLAPSPLDTPAPGAARRRGWLVPAALAAGVMALATVLVVAIGPEGGWSPRDRDTLSAAGFTGLRLGPRILRTETAGLAAIAALQSRFGDL